MRLLNCIYARTPWLPDCIYDKTYWVPIIGGNFSFFAPYDFRCWILTSILWGYAIAVLYSRWLYK